jgi:hypothetical protein
VDRVDLPYFLLVVKSRVQDLRFPPFCTLLALHLTEARIILVGSTGVLSRFELVSVLNAGSVIPHVLVLRTFS